MSLKATVGCWQTVPYSSQTCIQALKMLHGMELLREPILKLPGSLGQSIPGSMGYWEGGDSPTRLGCLTRGRRFLEMRMTCTCTKSMQLTSGFGVHCSPFDQLLQRQRSRRHVTSLHVASSHSQSLQSLHSSPHICQFSFHFISLQS